MAVTELEPDIMTFEPKRQEYEDLARLVRLGQVRWVYDGLSDTMMVQFYDPNRPAASVPLDRGDRDYLYLRVDVETQEVVGFQVEHFLAYAVGQTPGLIGALDFADLHGITVEEVEEIKRRAQPEGVQSMDAAAALGSLARMAA